MRQVYCVLAVLVILAGMVTVAGCSGSAEVIRIGASGPFSGQLSKIGLDSLNAVRMAVEEANAAGGIDGKKVELVVGDDEGDPSKAMTVAEKFAGDRSMFGVVGPMNSTACEAALPIYDQAGMVIISQSATNPRLTHSGRSVMFRVCPGDDAQGSAAAAFINNTLKARRVYVIDDRGTYGRGLADQVSSVLEKSGVSIERGQILSTDKDFASILTRVRGFGPDLLYLALSSPAQAALILKQMNGLGMKLAVMGGDGLRDEEELIRGSGGLAEGVYVTAFGPSLESNPAGAAFARRFQKRFGAMSIYTGQGYEATVILLNAIKAAAGSGRLSRKAVRDQVARTSGFRGVLGFPVTFATNGDLARPAISVFRVTDGRFQVFATVQAGEDKP